MSVPSTKKFPISPPQSQVLQDMISYHQLACALTVFSLIIEQHGFRESGEQNASSTIGINITNKMAVLFGSKIICNQTVVIPRSPGSRWMDVTTIN